jgi:ribose transport system substrate-binding protein
MKTRKLFSLAGFISLFLISMSCQDLVDEVVGKKPEDTRNINITMIAKSSSNPVFQSARVGAEDAAKDLSEKHSSLEVTINWRTPLEEDPQGQAERIRNAVEDGTDAILVSCSDEEILTPVINSAVDSGVPVMTFDSDAPESKRFAFYGPNDVEIGERVMSELAALLNNEGQVAILGGSQNAPNLRKRVEGVQEKAREYPGIDIVGVFYHVETAEAAAAELIKVNDEYPNLKGWAMVGGWPFFTDDLLDKLDPQAQKIVAVDALPIQLTYLEKGIVDVLLGQPTFKWGRVSVETIIGKIYLEKEVPVINQMKLIPVSRANLGGWARQLRAWGYENVPRRFLTM